MDVINRINAFVGADWSFEDFSIDYERVSIRISYNAGSNNSDHESNKHNEDQYALIHCNNFIGFSFVGHWDENIIECMKIESAGDLIDNSLQEIRRLYGALPLPGGGVKNLESVWYQLNIKLIDGNMIKIVCESFEFKTPS